MGIFGGPNAEKILTKGSPAAGRIVGLELTYTHDDSTDNRLENYAIELATGDTIGVRQRLNPDEFVRLGMEVSLVVFDGAGVIDWPATGAQQGFVGRPDIVRHKALKDPPGPGIVDTDDDLQSARKKGEPAVISITAIADRTVFLGLGQATDVTATVTLEGIEPYQGEIKNLQLPFYASHLLRVGVDLPGFVRTRRLDKPIVDWPTAANAHPGVGEPPARPKPVPEPVEAMSTPDIDVRAEVDAAAAAADGGMTVGGITMETWVAVEVGLIIDRVAPAHYDEYASTRGVPAGTWAAATDAWTAEIMKDWRLAAARGEAFEAEMKRQKQAKKGR